MFSSHPEDGFVTIYSDEGHLGHAIYILDLFCRGGGLSKLTVKLDV